MEGQAMATVDLEENADEREGRIAARASELLQERRQRLLRYVDRMFLALMGGQWIFGILVALFFSPYGWEGKQRVIHFHVYTAVFLGGLLSLFPMILIWRRPGWVVTRHVVAISQMLWSALLIHLSGGRIETHFHVFGSLAFLAFYLDWKVLGTASAVVVADHLLRGLFWPESVYGIVNPEWWRFLEHAFWVVFEDVFLVLACSYGLGELVGAARRQAEVESLRETDQLKSFALEMALAEARA
jgi:two-component system, NtrC family, sensor histidine kinase HydH